MSRFTGNILVFLYAFVCNFTIAQNTFNSLDELLDYVNQQSITKQTNDLKSLQVKKQKLAVVLGIFQPTVDNSLSYTNNTQLPVSLFPAEIFGGESGTFQQIETGVPHTTTFSNNIDLKLFNTNGWYDFKIHQLEINLTETDNKLTIKNLHENIASNYHTIIQLQEQLETTKQNLMVADSLLAITENKFSEGFVNRQDVNDSKINQINIAERVNQLEYMIQQNYLSLKILCDIPENERIKITNQSNNSKVKLKPKVELNNLEWQRDLLLVESALKTYKKEKFSNLPELSFVFNNSQNQFNQDFTLFGGNWVQSQYFGFRLSKIFSFSSSIKKRRNAKYDYEIAEKTAEQTKIKASLEQKQLEVDYEKALSQYSTNQEIVALREDTYSKNQNLYKEGFIDLDQTLNSFNAMVDSQYDLIESEASLNLALSKIKINNEIY